MFIVILVHCRYLISTEMIMTKKEGERYHFLNVETGLERWPRCCRCEGEKDYLISEPWIQFLRTGFKSLKAYDIRQIISLTKPQFSHLYDGGDNRQGYCENEIQVGVHGCPEVHMGTGTPGSIHDQVPQGCLRSRQDLCWGHCPWAVTPVTELEGASEAFWLKLVFTEEETEAQLRPSS